MMKPYKFIGGFKAWVAMWLLNVSLIAGLITFQVQTNLLNQYVFLFLIPAIIFSQVTQIFFLGPLLSFRVELTESHIIFYLTWLKKEASSYYYKPEVKLDTIERVLIKDTHLRVTASGKKYIFPRFLITDEQEIIDLSLELKPQF